jgi:hypothetical protein
VFVVLDKLKFWKKQDDLFSEPNPSVLGNESSSSFSDPYGGSSTQSSQDQLSSQDPYGSVEQQDPYGSTSEQQYPGHSPFPGQEPMQQQHVVQESSFGDGRDVELILAKLDMIKSELDSLHQRVRRIEQLNEPAGKKERYW